LNSSDCPYRNAWGSGIEACRLISAAPSQLPVMAVSGSCRATRLASASDP